MKKIAIIIPTFNERDNIALIISRIYALLPYVYIVVVDDNSPDQTGNIVLSEKKKYPRLFLLKRVGRRGRGSAVTDGFRFARKRFAPDLYIEMDADLSHNPQELSNIIRESKESIVVCASRYLPKSKIIGWELERRIMSSLSNKFIRVVLTMPLRDNTNGFRCYPASAVRLLLRKKFVSDGYIVLSEIAYYLIKKGFKFKEIPTIFRNRARGQSNTSIAEFINALITIIKIKLKK